MFELWCTAQWLKAYINASSIEWLFEYSDVAQIRLADGAVLVFISLGGKLGRFVEYVTFNQISALKIIYKVITSALGSNIAALTKPANSIVLLLSNTGQLWHCKYKFGFTTTTKNDPAKHKKYHHEFVIFVSFTRLFPHCVFSKGGSLSSTPDLQNPTWIPDIPFLLLVFWLSLVEHILSDLKTFTEQTDCQQHERLFIWAETQFQQNTWELHMMWRTGSFMKGFHWKVQFT